MVYITSSFTMDITEGIRVRASGVRLWMQRRASARGCVGKPVHQLPRAMLMVPTQPDRSERLLSDPHQG